MTLPGYLLTLSLAGLVLWQLLNGKALDRRWQATITRQENPERYWFIVLFQSAILVIVLVTGKTSWHYSSTDKEAVRAAPSAQQAPSPVRQHREKAFALHRAGKLAEAIPIYDELLRASDADAELHYWRAMALWAQQHADLALQDFRRVIELQPENFEAHRSADRILSQQQRWDEILELWNRYLSLRPADAEAYFERSGTNFHKGDLAAAQADAAKACELGKAAACAHAEPSKHGPAV